MSLYKYYHPDSFDFICVEDGVSARFSQPSILNDVFEFSGSLPYENEAENNIILNSLIEDHSEIEKIKPDLLILIIEKIKKLNRNEMKKEISDYIDSYYGIFSLSKNYSSSSMWAYYSNDHQGFMISFNENDTLESILNSDHVRGFVNYSNDRPNSLTSIVLQSDSLDKEIIVKKMKDLLFTKSNEWFIEKEFRIVMNLNDIIAKSTDKNGYPIHAKIIPKSSIYGIYLGVRSNDSLKRKAQFWIKNHSPNTKLFKAEACHEKFNITYTEIT